MNRIPFLLVLAILFHITMSYGEVWESYYPGNDVRAIGIHGDAVWCLTSGSIVRWDKRDASYTQYTKNEGFPVDSMNNIYDMVLDRDGVPWFAYRDKYGMIFRYDGSTSVVYSGKDHDIPYSQFTNSFRDSRGNLWFGTQNAGIVRFDGSTFKTFTPQETPSGAVAMAIDTRGVVWVAANGLLSFDGNEWKTYSTADGPSDTVVRCITACDDGTVWFGTTMGITRFDGASWKNFTSTDGWTGGTVGIIVPDRRGGIWAGTSGGAYHYDGSVWKSYRATDELIANKITGIAVDALGNAWFSHGSAGYGMSMYDGKDIKWWTTFNTSIPTNEVCLTAAGPDGIVWCVTADGLMSWDGTEWRKYTLADGIVSSQITGFFIDALNRKWFLRAKDANAGAVSFDGATWKTYTTADGLGSNAVNALAVGAGGVFWFGGPDDISYYNGAKWDHYPKNDRLLSPYILDITEDVSGVMWFATANGLTRFDGRSWWTYTTANGLPKELVLKVESASDGSVWLNCGDTLLRFDGALFHAYPIPMDTGLPEGFKYSIVNITVDNEGAVWTDVRRRLLDASGKQIYGGLWCFANGEWVEHPFPLAGIAVNNITFDDSGAMWFSAFDGLKRFDGVSVWNFRVNGPVNAYFDEGICDVQNRILFVGSRGNDIECVSDGVWSNLGLNSVYWQSIMLDINGTIWGGTFQGIAKYDGVSVEVICPRNGYPDGDQSVNFTLDASGIIWAVFFKGRTLYRFRDGTWTPVTDQDGPPAGSVNQVFCDGSGRVWVSTSQTIYWYDGSLWRNKQLLSASVIRSNPGADAWISAWDGIYRFDGAEWNLVLEKKNLPEGLIYCKAIDNNAHLWMGMKNNAVEFNGEKLIQHPLPCNGAVGNMVVDKNNIKWVISDYGVFSLDDRAGAGEDGKPRPVILRGNRPNPFNAGTTIEFDLYTWSRVDLSVYNISGQKVRTLVSGKLNGGRNGIYWDGSDDGGRRVSSGPYFCRLRNEGRVETGKMLFLK